MSTISRVMGSWRCPRSVWCGRPDGVDGTYVYDVSSGNISRSPDTAPDGRESSVLDTHDDAVAYAVDDKWHLVLDLPGRAPQDYPGVDPYSRFSPSGRYVLSEGAPVAPTGPRHAAAIIDTGTGELRPVSGTRYAWIAWSYGDIALVQDKDELLACDAARHTCEKLPAEPPFLMPTS